MKKMFTITICALMLIFTNKVIAQGNAEEAANNILKAYKTKVSGIATKRRTLKGVEREYSFRLFIIKRSEEICKNLKYRI